MADNSMALVLSCLPNTSFVINGESASDYSGWSVSSAGDVNGDGLDDLIVGAYRSDLSGNTSPLITKPPVGSLALAISLRLMALLLALPKTI
jgi:hypothetical protein